MVENIPKRVLIYSKNDLRSLYRIKRNSYIQSNSNDISKYLKWFTAHIDQIIA